MIDRLGRRPRIVAASNVQDKAAVSAQDSFNFGRKRQEPLDVVFLVLIAVFFLEVKGVWR